MCRARAIDALPCRSNFKRSALASRHSKQGGAMTLGLSLQAVTILHVVISLIGIVSGLVVLAGLFKSQSMPGMTALFLLSTILTNATGFMFPFEKLLPSHIIAILSLVLLAIACFALYGMKAS